MVGYKWVLFVVFCGYCVGVDCVVVVVEKVFECYGVLVYVCK